MSKLEAELENLQARKELRIVAWIISESDIHLFVEELNEENMNLIGQEIAGRKVSVYKSMVP